MQSASDTRFGMPRHRRGGLRRRRKDLDIGSSLRQI
jgi:hypothetical protein